MIIGIFSHFFAVETTLAERQFFRALAKLIGQYFTFTLTHSLAPLRYRVIADASCRPPRGAPLRLRYCVDREQDGLPGRAEGRRDHRCRVRW